eukprot:TRINITY_DN3526_c0_g1_i5.p2 TRINITY_DN3526_c0_g1~~TRINITY_DN3526_c0_g1_i5.p2  ORF type:complete len:132 (+),score=19.47 TRINITY_DN3526_c0_g1_i5:24-398(+)
MEAMLMATNTTGNTTHQFPVYTYGFAESCLSVSENSVMHWGGIAVLSIALLIFFKIQRAVVSTMQGNTSSKDYLVFPFYFWTLSLACCIIIARAIVILVVKPTGDAIYFVIIQVQLTPMRPQYP